MSNVSINILSSKLIITLIIILSLISNANSDESGVTAEQLTAFRNEALEAHNSIRQKHEDTPNLEMNDDLNQFAQKHCIYLAQQKGTLEHSTLEQRMQIGSISGSRSWIRFRSQYFCSKSLSKISTNW